MNTATRRLGYNISLLFVLSLLLSTVHAKGLTHMGQSPHEHVMLQGGVIGGFGCNGEVRRVFPNDNSSSGPQFVVPSGKLLVITDFDWQVAHLGNNQLIQGENLNITLGAPRVLKLVTVLTTQEMENQQIAGGSSSSVSGVIFGPGESPRVTISSEVAMGIGSRGLCTRWLLMRGYLIDD